jgi:hypothetical protein
MNTCFISNSWPEYNDALILVLESEHPSDAWSAGLIRMTGEEDLMAETCPTPRISVISARIELDESVDFSSTTVSSTRSEDRVRTLSVFAEMPTEDE